MDIYQTPKTDVVKRDDYRGSPVKGIIFGLLIALVGSILFGLVVAVIFLVVYRMLGYNLEQLDQMLEGRVLLSLYLIGASLFTALGAYVCARIINYSIYRFALILALVILVLEEVIGLLLPETDPDPLWFTITSYASLLPMVLFGSYLWDKQRKV